MAYSSIDDLKKRLPESKLVNLTDDTGDGVINEQVVERAIADADAEINIYLQERYTIPLDPVPDFIKNCSIGITIYKLYQRRPDMGTPEKIVEEYKNIVSALTKIAQGIASLGVSPAPAESSEILKNKEKDDANFLKTEEKDPFQGF